MADKTPRSNEARFLVQRIPSTLDGDVSLAVCRQLLKAFYSRSYGSIYATLASSFWPPTVVPLRDHLLAQFREKTFSLLSRAYTTLSPSAATFYLGGDGASESAVVESLVAKGWQYDEDGLLHTIPGDSQDSRAQRFQDDRIGRLTGLVTHLTEE